MNKTDLVNAIAAEGLTKADSKKALDAVLNAISGALKEGDKVALIGFGTFSVTNVLHAKVLTQLQKRKFKLLLRR